MKTKNKHLAFLVGYLIPGMGHFYLGKRMLGSLFCFFVVSLYCIGIAMGGGILWEEMNLLTILAYIVKFFNGLPFLVTILREMYQITAVYFNEIGTTFILVSGTLNLLIMINLLDAIKEKDGK